MVPIILLAVFLKTLFVQRLMHDLQRAAITADADEVRLHGAPKLAPLSDIVHIFKAPKSICKISVKYK